MTLRREKLGPISFLTGGSGPTFLLLHGIPGSARSWERTASQLTSAFEVVVPDMLGFGESDAPTAGYYLDEQAAAVAQLLDDKGVTELYLGGHDIGAPLAVTLMRLYPRFRVRGLLIAAANLLAAVKITPMLRVTQMRFLNGPIVWLMIGNRIAHRVLHRTAVADTASYPWSEYKKHLTPTGLKYTRLLYQRTMLEFQSTYAPIEAFLPQVQAPTLLVWGKKDPILRPSLGRKIQRIMEHATLEIYDDAGHYLPEEKPTRLARHILDEFS